jgi:riboflavin kinase/FMN adenylyltransferase
MMRTATWEGFLSGSLGPGWQASIGVFDGFHLGHARLIEGLDDPVLKKLVLSFSSNPKAATRDFSFARRLTTGRQLASLLEAAGVEAMVLIDFSVDFSRLSGASFVRAIASSGAVTRVCVGEGFRCGKGLDSGTDELSRYFAESEIRFDVVPKLTSNGADISSSRIRALIEAGSLAEAGALLGRPYALDAEGSRIEAERRTLETSQVLPPEGVYIVKARTRDGSVYATQLHVERGLVAWEGAEASELLFVPESSRPQSFGSTRE